MDSKLCDPSSIWILKFQTFEPKLYPRNTHAYSPQIHSLYPQV